MHSRRPHRVCAPLLHALPHLRLVVAFSPPLGSQRSGPTHLPRVHTHSQVKKTKLGELERPPHAHEYSVKLAGKGHGGKGRLRYTVRWVEAAVVDVVGAYRSAGGVKG